MKEIDKKLEELKLEIDSYTKKKKELYQVISSIDEKLNQLWNELKELYDGKFRDKQKSQKQKPLGELILESGLITKEQLEDALSLQRTKGGKLGEILMELGYISELDLLRFLGKQYNYKILDFYQVKISKDILDLVPADIIRKYNIIPIQLQKTGGKKVLIIATNDPTNTEAFEAVQRATGYSIYPSLALETDIERIIKNYYKP